ncbi:LysM peptidoglycan-binding domain-containing protein [Macrococcus animalis]|uniref:LysM peptidoglycan-binding domain-containing protein n=1 Tax=Macrococcus animalis TaxID=3395467 RepID=UPI0039BE5DFD
MGTIQETGVKFTMQVDEMFKKFGLLEKSFDNLPLAAEKATNKMNTAFDTSMTSIKSFDDLLSKSGKDFDTKALQSELQNAQKEFTETGRVNKETMSSLQKEIKNVDWKSLDSDSRQTFKNVISNVNSVERNMKKLEDVKFLEGLPEDAKNAGKELILLEKDVDKVSKSMKGMDDGADFSKLNKGLQTAKTELSDVGKVSDDTMKAINTDIQSVDFSKIPEKAKGAFKDVETKAADLESSLKNVGKGADFSGVSDGMQDIATNSDEADGNVGLLAASLGKFKGAGYVGIIVGVGAAFTQITKGALDANDAINELQVQTGETGKELEGMKKVMYDIYGNNFGNDMADIADVLSTVKTATNLTGKELQKATENAILMRDSFDWEPEESMNAVRAMMKNFNISQEEAFNLLAQGRQQMGKGADDILDTFKEYGSAFHEIGLSGEDSMNMMNNAMDAGIVNTDKAADAINEMSILMREMPETAIDAMDTIGLSAGDVQSAFAAGGDMARDMFFKVTDGLKNVKDGASRNAAGIGIFGTMWEDAGEKAILALGNTKGEINKSKDALKGMNEVKYNNVTGAMQGIGRAISANVLLPLQDKMMPAINGGIKMMYEFANKIKGAFDMIKNIPSANVLKKLGFSNAEAKGIAEWFNTLKKQLSLAGGVVKGFFQLFKGNGTDGVISLSKLGLKPETIQKLDAFVQTFKKTFKSAFDEVSKQARNLLSGIAKFFNGPDGKQLVQAFKNIFGAIATVVKVLFPVVKFLVKSIWDNIVGVIRGGMQVIKGIIQVFSGLFTGDFKKMWEGIKNIFFGAIKLVWNGVQLLFYGKLLKGVAGFVKLFAGGLKSMWGNIIGFFKSFGGTLWKNTSAIFSNIWKSVSKIFGNLVKWLVNSAKGMASSVGNWFKSLWTNSVKFLKSMGGGLSKIWVSIKKVAYDSGKYLFDKVTGFFKSLWSNVSKKMVDMKNGLFNIWKSVKQHAYDSGKYVKDKVVGFIKDTYDGVKKWIGSIKDGFVDLKDSVVSKVKEMANSMSEKVTVGLNVMIDGVNWVADKLGMDKPLSRITPKKYSTGTGVGHPEDGWATVGDKGPGNGKGTREIVEFPNGKTALFEKETTFWMPKGTRVYNNQQTEQMLEPSKYSTGTPGAGGKKGNFISNAMGKIAGKATSNYIKNRGADNAIKDLKTTAKAGETVQDVYEYATNPGKLLDLALSKFGLDLGAVKGIPGDLFKKGFGKLKSGAVDLITKWFEDTSGGDVDGGEILSFPLTTIYSPNKRPPGYPFNANHYGIDLATPAGTTLHAPTSGSVSQQSDFNGGLIARLVSGKYAQYFLHLQKVLKTGKVKQGDAIVKTGNSGHMTTGAHLHYQVEEGPSGALSNRNTINPVNFLKQHGGGSIAGGIQGKGSWANKIRQAAKQMKTSVTESQVNGLLAQMQRESGFRETVTQGNIGDINNLLGTPAKGLLQYVPSTFNAYKVPGYNNINNGYHQLLAFFNNSNWKNDLMYGKSGWGPRGTKRFANGGFTKGESYIAGEEYEEAIIPMDPKRKGRANELLAQANYKVNGPVKYSTGTQKTHTVKWGDTLWDISRKNNTTVKFLQALNNIKNHLIYPGQIIKLTESIKKLDKNVVNQSNFIKKASVKPQPVKTVMKSRGQQVLDVAKELFNRGNNNPNAKTSKLDLSIGKYILDKLSDYGKQSLTTLSKNVKDIIKKIDTGIKSVQSTMNKNVTKNGTLSTNNVDLGYKIDALKQEKALNGKTGTINVKTRLKALDTTLIDKQIKTTKTNRDKELKEYQEAEKHRKKVLASLEKAKREENAIKKKKLITVSDRNKYVKAKQNSTKWKNELKKIEAEAKKKNAEYQAHLKKLKNLELQRNKMVNRYKVTSKTVKGRSNKVLDAEIKKANDKIKANKKTAQALKSENKMFSDQIKNLKTVKNNEVLKNQALSKLVKRREELMKMMEALKAKNARLKEEKVSFKDGISENLQGYAGFGAAKGNTARDFVEFMKYRLGKVRKFSANMTKLKQMGLDPEIMKEMIAGGIESAMPRAEVLISGGSGYISQINALQAEVNKAIEWIAGKQADNVYDPQIADTVHRMNVVKSSQSSLDVQAKKYMATKTKVPTKAVTTKASVKSQNTSTKKTTKVTTKNHKIVWGDTLGAIAKKYGTTVAELKKYNGLKNDTIIAGKTLKIPIKTEVVEIVSSNSTKAKSTAKTTSKPATAKKVNSYIVKAGDTLSGIAAKYKTTVAKIKAANSLKSDLIRVKQKLKIPGYASGGIIDIPQLAFIAEGGFAESIISHDPSKRVQQQRIWKETGDKLGFDNNDAILREIYSVLVESKGIQEDFKNSPTVAYINPREVGKATAPYVEQEIVRQQQFVNRGLSNGR